MYKYANIITPNLKELLKATNFPATSIDDKLIERLSKKLIKSFKVSIDCNYKKFKGYFFSQFTVKISSFTIESERSF